MTYLAMTALTLGKQFPLAGKNIDGENVIIEHRTAKQTGVNYFKITTAQANGWTRINHIYEDGAHEELYQK